MNRKQLILKSSLILFSKKGIAGTSTKSIANIAGVSEGLIFRHYQNKDGLVDALMEVATEKLKEITEDIIHASNPKDILYLTIISLTKIPITDYPLWKLIFTKKFENKKNDYGLSNLLKEKVIEAFRELRFTKAKLEAELLLNSLDGMILAMLMNEEYEIEPLLALMIKKYQLNNHTKVK
mgnify:CR=1 FL=1|tara:strand:+ start:6875 stop:7414 length:540 start_codon:yes stop_codon:yes gene_type:complete